MLTRTTAQAGRAGPHDQLLGQQLLAGGGDARTHAVPRGHAQAKELRLTVHVAGPDLVAHRRDGVEHSRCLMRSRARSPPAVPPRAIIVGPSV
ncbi:hypothetical protein WDV85_15640 [Pseudokineococcus sp. 5B2Z-1]|uniref:hypothetical protein n=1 Tax=Pseudokineococcus sp. 5B2Z-1 TaxID=3132744 RepID=UPI0030B4E843